jgi:hypothetical protein
MMKKRIVTAMISRVPYHTWERDPLQSTDCRLLTRELSLTRQRQLHSAVDCRVSHSITQGRWTLAPPGHVDGLIG